MKTEEQGGQIQELKRERYASAFARFDASGGKVVSAFVHAVKP